MLMLIHSQVCRGFGTAGKCCAELNCQGFPVFCLKDFYFFFNSVTLSSSTQVLVKFFCCLVQTLSASYSYSGRLKSQKVHMVPENEFHHKEQPARSATPANQQNGPGSTSKPAANMSKAEEGTSEDSGEC